MAGDTLITGLAEMGVPGHVGFALFRPEGSQLAVQLIVGHAMAPVSASGRTDDRAHQAGEGDDHEHAGDDAGHETEEEDHGAAATPAG
jgi:hypothetical protein